MEKDELNGSHEIRMPPAEAAKPKAEGIGTAGGVTMAAGYGNHGASKVKNSFLGWIVEGGAPEDDIDQQASTLRRRARDLDMGGGIPRAAVQTETTTVVGTGLVPKPCPDIDGLGITEEEGQEWIKTVKREFGFWANSKFCDAAQRKNFYQLQSLAFRSFLVSGDVIALLPMIEVVGSPYQLHIQLLEADRLATPESNGESTIAETKGGGRIIDGVEIDKSGRVVRYHITNRHPRSESQTSEIEDIAIDAYGKETGMPNVLHVYVPERPEQYRGVPMVAPIIEDTKQLSRYTNAELTASVVSSMFTLFITSEPDIYHQGSSLVDAVGEEERVTDDPTKIHMRAGAVYELEPGQKPQSVSATRNNQAFSAFVDTICTLMGSAIEMPKEILLKAFTKSYSASRAALTEYWRKVPRARRDFIADFCQPIYEAFLAEAVAIGRIDAPGFFDDPIIRACWCKCSWIGSSMQQLDPLKEVNAARERIKLNISTEAREAMEFNGSDWEDNISQRRREIEAERAMGVNAGNEQEMMPDDQPEEEDDEDEKEENENAENSAVPPAGGDVSE